jgi:hypothetical protein
MAIINKKGIIRGSVGDLVFRYRSGKNILSAKPSASKKEWSQSQLAHQQKIKFSAALSSAMYSVPAIVSLWSKSVKKSGAVYNRIMKFNYHDIGENYSVSGVSLSPAEGTRKMIISELNIFYDRLFIKMNHINPGNLTAKVSFQVVILAENPFDLRDPSFTFVPVYTGDFIIIDKEMEMEEFFDNYSSEELKKYNNYKILINSVYKENNGKLTGFSDTFYFERSLK